MAIREKKKSVLVAHSFIPGVATTKQENVTILLLPGTKLTLLYVFISFNT